MDLKMFDKVLLKTGETAYVVDIYEDGKAYEMDINKPEGKVVTDTVLVQEIDKRIN